MKKLLLTLSVTAIALLTFAQAPNMMNYQGVARNAAGNVIPAKTIGLRLSILTGSPTGTAVYVETRTVVTNGFGLFNVGVGSPGATSTIGTIAGVNWAQTGLKFLQVELDPEGGSNYVNVGSTQLLSTPFTLYSNVTGDIILPFSKTQADNGFLFKVTNSGNNSASSAIEGVTNSTAANATAVKGTVSSTAPGTLSAGLTGQNNGNGTSGAGVIGQHNGSGWGVYGISPGGTGVYGQTTTGTGVYGTSTSGNSVVGFQPATGSGNAGLFQNTNPANAVPNILGSSNGAGDGIQSSMTGTGKAGSFIINNAANSSNVLSVTTNGTGIVGNLSNTNAANPNTTFNVVTNGAGDGAVVTAKGTGKAAWLAIDNVTNSSNVLNATTNGLGGVGLLQNTNAANNNTTLDVLTNGTGFAGNFTNTNAAPKALRTQGAIQFTGIGESLNKVLSTDNAGNATWNSAAAVGIVTGTGTPNYLSKWQASGTGITNTQVIDDGTNVGINNATPSYRLDVLATGNDDGLRIRTNNNNNLRFRMVNSTNKEFDMVVGGSASSFGNGNFLINDATAADANRFLINGNTGNIAIGGGSLTPTEKLWVNGTGRFKNNVFAEKSLHVTDSISSSDLNVKGDSKDYVAIFENTHVNANNEWGDGIQIKLGNTHPMWDGSAWVQIANPILAGVDGALNKIRGWAYGTGAPFSISDIPALVPSSWIAGTVINITNYVTDQLNSALHLPLRIGPYATPAVHIWNEVTIFGGLGMPPGIPDIPAIRIPALDIPSVTVIPNIEVFPKIPAIPDFGLPSLTWPNLRLTNVSNTLTNENEFINFADKDGRQLGSIKASSIQDFSINYFDALHIAELLDQMAGIDILKDILGIFAGISRMAADFNNIGVEYTSGHGDYAEWLERSDINEPISAGDIVGVKAGKITKDLKGAEQIMAVSFKPIVLGNIPEKGKENVGNNVAFMGQIPVKVMGPVTAGDYIIAKGNIAGYGVAVHPKDMTIEDHKLVVGRSWATNENVGPKAVNTVVGVVNNGFLNIISDLKKKAEVTDNRLKAIEESLKLRSATITNTTKKN